MRYFIFRALRFGGLVCAIAALLPMAPAGAIPYHGTPDLQLTSDLLKAGTGPKGFDSHLLVSRLYGPKYRVEIIHLRERYGATYTADFFTLMNYSIADVVKMVTRDKVAVPPPDKNIVAARLDRELIVAGTPGGATYGKYDVGYMLEKLISNKYHEQLMMDLNMHFSQNRVATFHSVLGSLIVGPNPKTGI